MGIHVHVGGKLSNYLYKMYNVMEKLTMNTLFANWLNNKILTGYQDLVHIAFI